jgi:hypothetical protein
MFATLRAAQLAIAGSGNLSSHHIYRATPNTALHQNIGPAAQDDAAEGISF